MKKIICLAFCVIFFSCSSTVNLDSATREGWKRWKKIGRDEQKLMKQFGDFNVVHDTIVKRILEGRYK